MNRYVIGFAGPAGAGKSWTSSMVAQMFLEARIFGFADPLKEAYRALDPGQWKGWARAKAERNGREVAHVLGDAMRTYEPSFFERRLRERVDEYCRHADGDVLILIDDVRTQAEVDMINNDLGGSVIYITNQHVQRDAGNHWIERVPLARESILPVEDSRSAVSKAIELVKGKL